VNPCILPARSMYLAKTNLVYSKSDTLIIFQSAILNHSSHSKKKLELLRKHFFPPRNNVYVKFFFFSGNTKNLLNSEFSIPGITLR